MNIVIPFRNTCGTQELQMCIKLIEKNMQDLYSCIYVVGDEIDFENDNVNNIIVEEQKYNKWLDSGFLILCYMKIVSSKEFILFNDDFFITKKIQKKDLSHYYCGTLGQRIMTTYVIEPKTEKLRLSAYGMNIHRFLDLFGDYPNYEVHIPMIVSHPKLMAKAIEDTKELDCPALKRTYYMKLLTDKGLITEEDKVAIPHDSKFGEPIKVMSFPFFSLTDSEYKAFEKDFQKILSE